MEIASSRGWEKGWDLTRGEFVMVVQRSPPQYLDYLQGLLHLVLHPPWGYQVDGILEKHSMEFNSVNIFIWPGKKRAAGKLSTEEEEASNARRLGHGFHT